MDFNLNIGQVVGDMVNASATSLIAAEAKPLKWQIMSINNSS